MSIVAIDVGYRNFAWIKVDAYSWNDPLIWRHEDWWCGRGGRPSREDILRMTCRWITTNFNYLKNAKRIILERQLKIPFAVMNACIYARFPEQCEFISPNTVGAFWGLPSRRKAKKAAGITTVLSHGLSFPDARKADDLADTWLMAVRVLVLSNEVPRQMLREAKAEHIRRKQIDSRVLQLTTSDTSS